MADANHCPTRDAGAGLGSVPEGSDPQATQAHTSPTADATGEWSDAPGRPIPDAGPATTTTPLRAGSAVSYFGDYEVVRELGRGGMGVVYEARQVSLNRPVALKLIKAGLLADDAELRRFQNEAEAVALLDHPGIVSAYEVGEHEGQQYLAMKLVRGESLGSLPGRYRDDPRAAASLVAEAAEAVAHAHSRGILHRDLKPANILVDADGRPHITDFGLAKRIEGDAEMTASGAILGTPAYMAPEQATGRRGSITTATDVYGLGAVLYALLTGEAPFAGETVVETLDALRTQPPAPPVRLNAGVPRDLETICLKCLEKDPRRRYASAQAMADDVRAWLGSRPIAARRVGVAERAWLWCRRRPAVAALAAAVLLAIVGGAAATIAVQANANRALRDKNRELTDAYGREARANAELSEANARVEQRYNLAMDAIKTFHTGVSEDFLLKEKGLAPLRKNLLASARTFYTRLEGQLRGKGDRASRAALARTYRALALLTFEIDSAQAALAIYQQALGLQRELAADGADGPDATADLAETLLDTISPLQATLRAADRDAASGEARSLMQDLVRRHPGVERYEADLARSLLAYGISASLADSPAKKLDAYRQSHEIYRRLAGAHPKDLDHRRGLAESTAAVGWALREDGRAAEGEAALKQAIEFQEQLTRAEPDKALHRNAFAIACLNYAGGLGNARSEEALAYFRKALGIWEGAQADHPNNRFFQANVAYVHDMIAKRLCVLDRPREEAAAYEGESAAYERTARSDPTNPMYIHEVADCQEILATLYARSGRPADALAAARRAAEIREELARTHPDFQPDRLLPCLVRLGDAQKAAGRDADARATYEKAMAACRKKAAAEGARPGTSTLRGLGCVLQRLGRTAEAATAFRDALARIQAEKAPDAFERARTRALLAGIAPEPGSGIDPAEAEALAAEAVADLRRHVAGRHATIRAAAEAKYLDVHLLDKTFQLDALRDRADFRALIREMRAQGPPKPP